MASQAGLFRSSPNRRRFLQGAAALVPFLGRGLYSFAQADVAKATAGHTLFVGTQTVEGSQGVYAYTWDPNAGTLQPQGLATATPMPTFLALSPDKQYLFAANETDSFDGAQSGGVSSFRVPGSTASQPPFKLTPINSEASGGGGTCYVSLDRTGGVLLCANYGGGSASSFKVSTAGEIGPIVSHFQYTGSGPDHARQDAPHVHRAMASPGNRFALFNDLGLDQIHIYKLDAATATLTPHEPAAWHAPAGSGPRALSFHPNGKWAYCVTEMGNCVILLAWDESTGTLTTRQQVSLIPAGFTGRSQSSELTIDHSGQFLYAADRYYDGVYSFAIDARSGELHSMMRTPCAGKTPRFITLDPTERWLLSASQDSDCIEVFARDPRNGKLGARSKLVPQVKPQCLVFV
ncbi:lactonase family protein [Acidipila sp. EB88]|uniref:lactonase family protein n=1 Tax=Acidipila sp. EB88 TaxID=2305226 RepID=UPI000F5FCC61|nr:lactonase family protein [Acidipila sp. EB88]RRA48289.1 lactonase family protein [Acidipila sp. EB88]